jgi:hypothetical protein
MCGLMWNKLRLLSICYDMEKPSSLLKYEEKPVEGKIRKWLKVPKK